jgi:hypothetical protein
MFAHNLGKRASERVTIRKTEVQMEDNDGSEGNRL